MSGIKYLKLPKFLPTTVTFHPQWINPNRALNGEILRFNQPRCQLTSTNIRPKNRWLGDDPFGMAFWQVPMLVVDFREDTLLQTKMSQQPTHFRVDNFPFAVWWDMLVVVEDTPSKTNRWIPKIMVWKKMTP